MYLYIYEGKFKTTNKFKKQFSLNEESILLILKDKDEIKSIEVIKKDKDEVREIYEKTSILNSLFNRVIKCKSSNQVYVTYLNEYETLLAMFPQAFLPFTVYKYRVTIYNEDGNEKNVSIIECDKNINHYGINIIDAFIDYMNSASRPKQMSINNLIINKERKQEATFYSDLAGELPNCKVVISLNNI